jgi:hypothetical protein
MELKDSVAYVHQTVYGTGYYVKAIFRLIENKWFFTEFRDFST